MPRLSILERVAQSFSQMLLTRETAALETMADAYTVAARRLVPLWQEAYRKLQAAKAAGVTQDYLSGYIWQEQRMSTLLAEMGQQFDAVARQTSATLSSAQREAIELATQSLTESLVAVAGENAVSASLGLRFPTEHFERMVGQLGDGSPITDLAKRYGDSGPRVIREALLQGVANGDSPRVVARRINKALGKHYGNTVLMTRTELLRVYREGTRATYQANQRYVRGWVWCSARDRRTCPVCWAMHGTKHSITEPMASHPACRCSMIPDLVPWSEIMGQRIRGSEIPTTPLGTDLFRQLPAAQQRAILGPMAHTAYSKGLLELTDLVAETYSPTWGAGRRQRSLASVVGPQRLKYLT